VNATDTRFVDTTVFQDINTNNPNFAPQNTRYYYAVVPVDAIGIMGKPAIDLSGITPNFTAAQFTAPPKQTRLLQSFPNPFNPEVWIPYELSEDTPVSIELYTLTGELIRTLDLGLKPSGRYTTKAHAAYWDGRTQSGERAASGVYFYILKAGDFVDTRKMVILK
jgi:hypothetical protein